MNFDQITNKGIAVRIIIIWYCALISFVTSQSQIVVSNNACFSASDRTYATIFSPPWDGVIEAVELEYVSGPGVTCDNRPTGFDKSNWGCNGYPAEISGGSLSVTLQRTSGGNAWGSVEYPQIGASGVTVSTQTGYYSMCGACPYFWWNSTSYDHSSSNLVMYGQTTVYTTDTFSLQMCEAVCGNSVDNNEGNTCAKVTFTYSSFITQNPTFAPTEVPTDMPTDTPTDAPSLSPSKFPTKFPTDAPSVSPTNAPSSNPSLNPSYEPTLNPSSSPSQEPSQAPSQTPTGAPTQYPSLAPTQNPSLNPSLAPTMNPTSQPSLHPSVHPTLFPSVTPSTAPSVTPSMNPSTNPSSQPTMNPTQSPSLTPSVSPSTTPSSHPSMNPSTNPSLAPSHFPTIESEKDPELEIANFQTMVYVGSVVLFLLFVGFVAICMYHNKRQKNRIIDVNDIDDIGDINDINGAQSLVVHKQVINDTILSMNENEQNTRETRREGISEHMRQSLYQKR